MDLTKERLQEFYDAICRPGTGEDTSNIQIPEPVMAAMRREGIIPDGAKMKYNPDVKYEPPTKDDRFFVLV